MSGTEEVGVAFVATAFHIVVAAAAVEGVVTGTAGEFVVTCAAAELVVAFLSGQFVIAVITAQFVVAFATIEPVIAFTAAQLVVVLVAIDTVVSRAGINDIGVFPAIDGFAFVRAVAGNTQFGDVVAGQGRVIKLQVVIVDVGGGVPEEALDVDLILFVAIGTDGKVVAFAAESGVFQLRTAEAQGVGFRLTAGGVNNTVPAMPGTEEVGVAFVATAFHIVVAAAAVEGVVTGTTGEFVVTCATIEIIVSCFAFQSVVAGKSQYGIRSITSC